MTVILLLVRNLGTDTAQSTGVSHELCSNLAQFRLSLKML